MTATIPVSPVPPSQRRLWLGLSLAVALGYGLWAWQFGLAGPYRIQDDARQHVFWMQRYLDPALFPNDLIADYFQSVAPWGYSQLYRLGAWVGLDPITLSKALPSLLGVLLSYYCFQLSLVLFPRPMAGFGATLLLNQNLWLQDGIVSATPKAFFYPTFLAFLYYFARRRLSPPSPGLGWQAIAPSLPLWLSLVAQALFYPQAVLLSAGLLALDCLGWRRGRGESGALDAAHCGSRGPLTWFTWPLTWPFTWAPPGRLRLGLLGLGLAIAALLPYLLSSSDFGPVITVAQARQLPEFFPGGRSAFFDDGHPWDFWVNGGRSGLRIASALRPDATYAALLLPLGLWRAGRSPQDPALGQRLLLLPQLLLVSLGWFLLAHGLLFSLHLPSRYSQHSLRIVLALAAAIAWTLLLDALVAWLSPRLRSPAGRRALGHTVTGLFLGWLLIAPLGDRKFPRTYSVTGAYPQLYAFLQAQPKDSLVASLSEAANNLPSFAQRSILAGSEYAIPYHWGYYQRFRQRSQDLLQAQYSPDLAVLAQVIDRYGIDFWLLDRQSFDPEALARSPWLRALAPEHQAALNALSHSPLAPALQRAQARCTVFEGDGISLLDGACLTQGSASSGER